MRHNRRHEVQDRQRLTPPEVAHFFGVSSDTVRAWIRSGQLRAINVAARLSSRPRYVVDRKDIAAFELRRQVIPPPPPQTRRRRPEQRTGIIEFV